jgi:hypothetical protein
MHWLSASTLRTALHCTALRCTALYCTVLCCTAQIVCCVLLQVTADIQATRFTREERTLLRLPPRAEIHLVDHFLVERGYLRPLDLHSMNRTVFIFRLRLLRVE